MDINKKGFKNNTSWSEWEWDNPPAPFNPDYKPHAKDCWDKSVILVEEEERCSVRNWDRPHRARRRRETYEQLMDNID